MTEIRHSPHPRRLARQLVSCFDIPFLERAIFHLSAFLLHQSERIGECGFDVVINLPSNVVDFKRFPIREIAQAGEREDLEDVLRGHSGDGRAGRRRTRAGRDDA
jgi:hypothetical protein